MPSTCATAAHRLYTVRTWRRDLPWSRWPPQPVLSKMAIQGHHCRYLAWFPPLSGLLIHTRTKPHRWLRWRGMWPSRIFFSFRLWSSVVSPTSGGVWAWSPLWSHTCRAHSSACLSFWSTGGGRTGGRSAGCLCSGRAWWGGSPHPLRSDRSCRCPEWTDRQTTLTGSWELSLLLGCLLLKYYLIDLQIVLGICHSMRRFVRHQPNPLRSRVFACCLGFCEGYGLSLHTSPAFSPSSYPFSISEILDFLVLLFVSAHWTSPIAGGLPCWDYGYLVEGHTGRAAGCQSPAGRLSSSLALGSPPAQLFISLLCQAQLKYSSVSSNHSRTTESILSELLLGTFPWAQDPQASEVPAS